ncbi:MAG TPA: hypothetical protein VGN32_04030, partial [Ktedonobacterales bacterium]|nr:hypothetical protein [Ktedonobacterales bacterium]
RGHGAAREMGQIQFVEGLPTAALLGQLTGNTAMNVLTNWGESYYTFDEAEMGEDDHLDPREGGGVNPAYGAWPSGDAGWNNRAAGGQGSGGSYPATPPPGSGGNWAGRATGASLGQFPPSPGPFPGQTFGTGNSGRLGGGAPSSPGPGMSQPSAPSSSPPGQSSPAGSMFPRRTSRSDLSDALPLDRRERMVLLLIDGRRSVADLGRLTRRNDDEVMAVLGNLKMLGLIE